MAQSADWYPKQCHLNFFIIFSWILLPLLIFYRRFFTSGTDSFNVSPSFFIRPHLNVVIPSPSPYPGPQVFRSILHRAHYLPFPNSPWRVLEFYPFKLVREIEKQRWESGGGSRANLNGHWKGWAVNSTSGEYTVQQYEGGDLCIGFGPRSADVLFKCIEDAPGTPKLRLVSATEKDVCKYLYEIETPLWCGELEKEEVGGETNEQEAHSQGVE